MSKFRIYFISCFIILCLVCFSNCAKRGYISGGPKDTLPPVMLKSVPKNYSINFDQDEIKIDFDEYVKINKVNQNLIVSPPLDNMPDVSPMGMAKKTVTIKIKDTLKPNTTYSFNFGDAIVDNNEGNILKQFKYVFSTGDYIDSLKVSGTISTANKLVADNFVNVMLYDAKTFTDSTVYKEKPLYITNTLDSLTDFTIENIKEGSYYLVALKDKNNNYKFDPKQDKIAFYKDSITVPTDEKFNLTLFKSDEKFEANRPSQISENKWYLPYYGDSENVKITVTKNDSLIRSTFTHLPQKDSLQVWFPKVIADSLHVTVEKEEFKKTFTVKPRVKIKEVDSLSITGTNSVLHYINDFKISTTTPLNTVNKELVEVFNKDSIAVPFTIENQPLDQNLLIKFEKEENMQYYVNLMPNALIDFFGSANDTLQYSVKTNPYTDYGNLTLNISGIKRYPIIVEVLDENEKLVSSQNGEEGQSQFTFNLLPPKKYYVRIIYDDNKNGKWDTGYYWDKRQPEETIYFKELIDVRANWDIDQQIDL